MGVICYVTFIPERAHLLPGEQEALLGRARLGLQHLQLHLQLRGSTGGVERGPRAPAICRRTRFPLPGAPPVARPPANTGPPWVFLLVSRAATDTATGARGGTSRSGERGPRRPDRAGSRRTGALVGSGIWTLYLSCDFKLLYRMSGHAQTAGKDRGSMEFISCSNTRWGRRGEDGEAGGEQGGDSRAHPRGGAETGRAAPSGGRALSHTSARCPGLRRRPMRRLHARARRAPAAGCRHGATVLTPGSGRSPVRPRGLPPRSSPVPACGSPGGERTVIELRSSWPAPSHPPARPLSPGVPPAAGTGGSCSAGCPAVS